MYKIVMPIFMGQNTQLILIDADMAATMRSLHLLTKQINKLQ